VALAARKASTPLCSDEPHFVPPGLPAAAFRFGVPAGLCLARSCASRSSPYPRTVLRAQNLKIGAVDAKSLADGRGHISLKTRHLPVKRCPLPEAESAVVERRKGTETSVLATVRGVAGGHVRKARSHGLPGRAPDIRRSNACSSSTPVVKGWTSHCGSDAAEDFPTSSREQHGTGCSASSQGTAEVDDDVSRRGVGRIVAFEKG
jgi:hypothetical protein